uniref:Uncharacterized protein n=1 Tax=Aegilops tauschii subsp. strangulata TaxID=200361 RepID=A0A453HR02_AEGTS
MFVCQAKIKWGKRPISQDSNCYLVLRFIWLRHNFNWAPSHVIYCISDMCFATKLCPNHLYLHYCCKLLKCKLC